MATGVYNWPQIGNDRVINFLEHSLNNNRLAQTYIFTGPSDLGKSTIALALARNLQGDQEGFNSDLHILAPLNEEKSISITATREFIKLLDLSSFSNSYKIGIIKEADSLSQEAKSALLKTLEEPKKKVIIILLVEDENSLPATILSRAQVLYFKPVPATVIYDYLIDNYRAKRSLAKDLANLSLGRPFRALHFLEHPEEYSKYLEKAEIYLSFFSSDLDSRLKNLELLFKDKSWSKQALDEANNIILMAQGLSRDLFLLHLEQPERIQHSALLDKLKDTLKYLRKTQGSDLVLTILRQLKLLAQAQEYLRANVNPHLTLEQVVINL